VSGGGPSTCSALNTVCTPSETESVRFVASPVSASVSFRSKVFGVDNGVVPFSPFFDEPRPASLRLVEGEPDRAGVSPFSKAVSQKDENVHPFDRAGRYCVMGREMPPAAWAAFHGWCQGPAGRLRV